MRRKVQMARIAQLRSIPDLAKQVQCSAEQLIAFESGQGILTPQLMKQVMNHLSLS
jgi:DNA-binding XRE family transcriptional regulator